MANKTHIMQIRTTVLYNKKINEYSDKVNMSKSAFTIQALNEKMERMDDATKTSKNS